jgi:quercetin dioxygenase-like cupin family protein
MSSAYTIVTLEEASDISGDYPGEMKMLTAPLQAEQVAFSHRVLAPDSGGMAGKRDGHSHKTQEEIYFVVSGTLTLKLDQEVLELPAGSAVRIAPSTARSAWNESDEEVELIMVSPKVDSLRDDVEYHEDFWAGV